MKKWLCLCALVAFCAVSPIAANAEKLDMSNLTCANFTQLDGDEVAMLYFWLDGYASHKSGNNVLDTDAVEGDLQALADLCKKNPSMKILDVFKE